MAATSGGTLIAIRDGRSWNQMHPSFHRESGDLRKKKPVNNENSS
jgi:hypothetical protein